MAQPSLRQAWHFETTVLPGGWIEVIAPELPSGVDVDVFVLPKSQTRNPSSAVEDNSQITEQRE